MGIALLSLALPAISCGSGTAARDGDAVDPDGGMGATCPALDAGEKRKLGACCSSDGDCASSMCWNGFCTRTCSGDQDCTRVATPTPFPVGTEMHCATNQVGESWTICLPGSGRVCTTDPAGCPAGESCVLGIDPLATSAGGLGGLCLTRITAGTHRAAGETCEDAGGFYQCEDQGGYLGNACQHRTCTRTCREDRDCPGAMLCATPLVMEGSAGVLSGSGLCVGPICGAVGPERASELEPTWQMGADSECSLSGNVCAPSLFRSELIAGVRTTTMLLTCVAPVGGAASFGQPCGGDGGSGPGCLDQALCLADPAGSFCSTLCRTDRDCPGGAYCVERPGAALPDGRATELGFCVPRARIPGATCATESDCAAGEGCLPVGVRSLLLTCNSSGAGSKSLGDACAGADECRSTECRDGEWQAGGAASIRSVCVGRCMKASDCGPGQVCEPHVFSTNGTPADPSDDLVQGVCRTLLVTSASASCTDAQSCTSRGTGDTCDVATGRCYTTGVAIGQACTQDSSCSLMQGCDVSLPFPGGACLSYGCDPKATSGVNACPAGSVCKQRFTDSPLYRCYEACTVDSDCSRNAEGYVCSVGACMDW